MRIDDATPTDIAQVALNMRDSDFRELSALYPAKSRIELATALVEQFGGRKDLIAARIGREPVAIIGTFEVRPHVVTLMFFATERFYKISASITRFVKQRLLPALVKAGAHRFECVSEETNTVAHEWLRFFGLSEEGPPLKNYGKNKERFIQFAWISEDAK